MLPHPTLAPVLMDDPDEVTRAVESASGLLASRFALQSAFTPLRGATALHVAVEYGLPHAEVHEGIVGMLLDAGATVDARVDRLTWGAGFEWETTIFDVTPVSYAQFGLLPQMHRDEVRISRVIARMLSAAGRPVPADANVPNRYLQRSSRPHP